MRKIALKYIGNGRWLHGIPARDLSREEVKQHGEDYLISTGLYEAIRKPTKKVISADDTTEG